MRSFQRYSRATCGGGLYYFADPNANLGLGHAALEAAVKQDK
jgi:hypothetical protein